MPLSRLRFAPNVNLKALFPPNEADMLDRPRPSPVAPALALTAAVLACSVYANLSFAVTDKAAYRFFPPFERSVNANDNGHLGAEYFSIARSLVAGKGYADPFHEPTGPTAWMPPVLPTILAGLLWACDGNKHAVMAVVVVLQVAVLVGTGLLVLALASRTCARVGAWVAAGTFLAAVLCDFHLCFQFTHDCWLVLLALDLLIAGLCWSRPLRRWTAAAGWGLFGGLCALLNPIIALAWGALSLVVCARDRAWSRFGLAVLAAALAVTPWTVRNYLVFGRLIPVKPNLAYELYQSQCLQPDGLIQSSTFRSHPIGATNREGREYQALGETAYLDRKREQFLRAAGADPLDFLDRAACRFLGATLWYVPFDRTDRTRRPWAFRLGRLVHPLPFLAALVLLFTVLREPLAWPQQVVVGVYLLYLLPYVAIGYYDRYGMPLLGAKVLLVVWAADRLLSFLPRRRWRPGKCQAASGAPTQAPSASAGKP